MSELSSTVKEIPFDSPLHEKILRNFRQRLKASRDEKSKSRDEAWKKAEDQFTAYMPETAYDAVRKNRRDQGGIPDYTTITLPYSYAMLLTAHTYYTSVFLARDPVFSVQGRHGESQTAETAVASLLDYQLIAGGQLPALFLWLMDPGKYGVSIIGHYWDREVFTFSQMAEVPRELFGMPIPGTAVKKLISVEQEGYVGNRLYNVRPQDFFHDPSVPIMRFQEGEFCIVYNDTPWVKVAKRAANGMYFNMRNLKETGKTQNRDMTGSGQKTQLPGQDVNYYSEGTSTPTMVDLHEFHWDLVPSELGLGNSDRPEKWVFTIGNEQVIVGAQPLGLAHNEYPFDVLTQEVEGYNTFNRSMLDILEPLNNTMDWLFNSHFYNVRASLNNMFAVDPNMIDVRSLEEPGPGKLIRLKPAAAGKDINTFLRQFAVSDVTRQNLMDSDVVAQLAQRTLGVNDNIMGSVNSGGRKTATEVRSSTTFGITRLKTQCEWFSATGFSPLTKKLLMSTQQLMEGERQFRIVGDQRLWGGQYLPINPEMIRGFFDFVPVDGTLPVDRFAQVNLWQTLLSNMARVPGALQDYDISRIFAFVAQLGGLKNIDRFRIQVAPDQQVQQMAQAGNVVAMKPNMQEPGQIPGMGSTG